MRNFFDAIIVEIQEDQSWKTHEILDFANVIMLEIQQSQSFLSFKKWHMC